METTRRRFLFGLSATGALTAIPLPALAAVEALAQAATPSALPTALFGEIFARLVGPIDFSSYQPDDAIEIDIQELSANTRMSFRPILIDSNDVTFKGFISKELQGAIQDGRLVKAAFRMPYTEGAQSEWMSVTMHIMQLRFDDKLVA